MSVDRIGFDHPLRLESSGSNCSPTSKISLVESNNTRCDIIARELQRLNDEFGCRNHGNVVTISQFHQSSNVVRPEVMPEMQRSEAIGS